MYQFKRYALFFGALMVAVMPYAIINAILISKDGVGLGSIGTLLIFGGSLFFASFLFHEIKLKYPKIQKTNKVDPKSEDLCNEPIQTEEMIPLEIEDANKEKAPVVSEIIEEKIETNTVTNDEQHKVLNTISNSMESADLFDEAKTILVSSENECINPVKEANINTHETKTTNISPSTKTNLFNKEKLKFSLKIFTPISLIIFFSSSIFLLRNWCLKAYVYGIVNTKSSIYDWDTEHSLDRFHGLYFSLKSEDNGNYPFFDVIDSWYIPTIIIMCICCIAFIIYTIKNRNK